MVNSGECRVGPRLASRQNPVVSPPTGAPKRISSIRRRARSRHRGQFLPLDRDQFGRVLGKIGAFGDHRRIPRKRPLSRAARSFGAGEGPVILVDHGDNTGSGGNQDVMAVLGEVIRQGLENVCAGPFCDPGAVAELIRAGVGADVTIELGGKVDMIPGRTNQIVLQADRPGVFSGQCAELVCSNSLGSLSALSASAMLTERLWWTPERQTGARSWSGRRATDPVRGATCWRRCSS